MNSASYTATPHTYCLGYHAGEGAHKKIDGID